MPHKFPPHLKNWLTAHMPPTHKMWWMRTELINIQEVVAQSKKGAKRYLRLTVRDIDAPSDQKRGYDFDVTGATKYKDYRPKDRISVFGHEPINATHLSIPRFFYHHDYQILGTCFETHFVDRNFYPIPNLVADVAGSPRDKSVKFWGRIAGGVGLLPEEIAHRLIGGGFDMRPLYQYVSNAIDDYLIEHPDPKFPCVNPRPENTTGSELVE